MVIPLDREVSSEEYEAIARKIAGQINIEYFDPTTFQTERLMYWPSISQDGEYVFREQYTEVLSADSILALYVNWKDVSSWPVSEKVAALNDKKMAAAAEDPLKKPGLIGLFCRTYPIDGVIEKFLPEIYVPGIPGRYSYSKGSTSNGVVVYADKWTYSHHVTDPASMRLCNAFDLVRIQLYGDLDKEGIDLAPEKMPSFKKMIEVIQADPEVLQTKAKEIKADFENSDPDSPWTAKLEVNRRGEYLETVNNLMLILLNDSELKNCFANNLFTSRNCLIRDLPWRKIKDNPFWTDSDDAHLRNYFALRYKIKTRLILGDVLNQVFNATEIHPVREYFNSLKWDGVPRIDEMLIKYMGAEDSKLIRLFTRKTMIAGVMRIMHPGCKFDNVLMLIGPQGCGKSSFVKMLEDPGSLIVLGISITGKLLNKCRVCGLWRLVNLLVSKKLK